MIPVANQRSESVVRGKARRSRPGVSEPMKTVLKPWAIAWLALATAGAGAEEGSPWQVTLGYSGQASDNIRLATTDTRSDVVHEPFLRVGYRHQGAVAEFLGNYRWLGRFYHRDTFSDDDVLEGTSRLNVVVVPSSLTWISSHTRSENLVNRRDPDRPDNRRVSDTIRTGLEYRTSAAATHQLIAAVHSEWFNSNRGIDDSQRYIGTLDLRRHVSPVTQAGVQLRAQTTDYDQPLVPDYDLWSASAYARRQLRTLEFGVSAGYSEADRSGLSTEGTWIASADLAWTPASGHQVGLELSRAFRDRTRFVSAAFPDAIDGRDQGSEGGQTFIDTHGALRYSYTADRWTAGLRATATDEDFQAIDRDTRRYGASGTLTRQLSRQLNVGVEGRAERMNFRSEDRKDRFYSAAAFARYQWSNQLETSLRYVHLDRDSDRDDRNYSENRMVLSISYRVR